MREIKFRGKRLDLGNGDWIYGGYYVDTCYGNKAGEKHYIMQWNSYGLGYYEPIRVVTETVGQYVGIKDENGVDVYEGDIVCVKPLSYATHKNPIKGIIEFDYMNYTFQARDWFGLENYEYHDLTEYATFKVIGNIHDKEVQDETKM